MMNETKKLKKGESAPAVREADGCEPQTGGPSKGPRKPDCPEGYPEQQPSDELVKEKQPPKK